MNEENIIEISPLELLNKLKNRENIKLIDVRDPESFKEWHIFDSLNYPLLNLIKSKDDLQHLKKEKIVTICTRGIDSLEAAEELKSRGFDVQSLTGGLTSWNKIFDIIEIPINNDKLKLVQFRRVSKGCLSYILHDTEEAFVFDPASHLEFYFEYINHNELNIVKVFDTHLHADHVSGAKTLATQTGSYLYLSNKDPYDKNIFDFVPINQGDKFNIGGTKVTAMWTPGHTKGSYSFKINSYGVLSGDIVFINSIGRPDLANQVDSFARDLYQSLNIYKKLSNEMFIAPAHHGHFTLEHFYKPLISDVKTFLKSSYLSQKEEEFIQFAKKKVESLPHPPSYQQIREINAGKKSASSDLITELEIGPNRCAIN